MNADVPEGWYADPSDPDQTRWWNGSAWTEQVMSPVPVATVPPPAAPAVKRRRRLPVWAWIVLAPVGLVLGILLAPILALIAPIVLITGIVALAKGTPTWLRLRSRKAAIAVTAVAAAFLLMMGGIASAVSRDDPSPVAADRAASPSATPAPKVEPKATPTPTSAPEDEASDRFTGEAATAADTSATAGTALAVLATLEVKGRAPKTGYDRDEFGQRWLDIDRNGCDTRNDILASQLTEVAKAGSCKVTSGTLAEPFTGKTIQFVRGQDTSALVQIDHVVSLSDAWQKGAQQLTDDQRATLANDPMNPVSYTHLRAPRDS